MEFYAFYDCKLLSNKLFFASKLLLVDAQREAFLKLVRSAGAFLTLAARTEPHAPWVLRAGKGLVANGPAACATPCGTEFCIPGG